MPDGKYLFIYDIILIRWIIFSISVHISAGFQILLKLNQYLDYNYTQRNHFEILLNETEIRLYLHLPIDLESNGRPFAVPNQSENGKFNLIYI